MKYAYQALLVRQRGENSNTGRDTLSAQEIPEPLEVNSLFETLEEWDEALREVALHDMGMEP